MSISINKLKESYKQYYSEVPVQRYAAMAIGRDEDTILRWRKQDSDFAEVLEKLKAEWVRKKMMLTKAEFALERLERQVFSPKTTLEVEVKPTIVPDQKLADDFAKFLLERTRVE